MGFPASAIIRGAKGAGLKGSKAVATKLNGAIDHTSTTKALFDFANARSMNQSSLMRTIDPSFTVSRGIKAAENNFGLGNSARAAYLDDASFARYQEKFANDAFRSRFSSNNAEEAMQASKELDDFFSAKDTNYDKARALWQGVAGVSTAYRIATGGGVYRDKNGEFNIIGVPGI